MSLAIRNDIQLQENHKATDIFNVLKQTIYPDAKSDESIQMVLDYCRVRQLDPLKKPVHIVPRKKKIKDVNGQVKWVEVDTILPGIASYRIDAARTGEYFGITEPEFGEEVTEMLGGRKVTYPKYCKIIVKRLVKGQVCEFTAIEFWKENYATKNYEGLEPTDMWARRSYGQLAKCTEAQALRKAFPEAVSNEYTKEEMEGKFLVNETTNDNVKLIQNNNEQDEMDFQADLERLTNSKSLDDLELAFKSSYKFWIQKKDREKVRQIIETKDKVKDRLVVSEFNDEIKSVEVLND